jgi:membrane protein DedA with SNARE-associated domain
MNRSLFIVCNAIGDIAWAVGFTLFGYYVASRIPHIEKYIEPAVIAVVVVFALPTLYHLVRDPKIHSFVLDRLKRRHRSD